MAIAGIDNLQPSAVKGLYAGNYIDFTDTSAATGINPWMQQFLPDVYEKESEIYGNRTIGGFLKMVSAEMPSSSDQVIWTEQGRLHTRYVGLIAVSAATDIAAESASGTASISLTAGQVAGTELFFSTVDGKEQPGGGDDTINFRIGQTVMVGAHTDLNYAGTNGPTIKGIVTTETDFGFGVTPYTAWAASNTRATTAYYTALAYGSEFAKGTGNFTEKLDPQYSTYTNSPIIMKEHYSINGSDASQIGWIEVDSENGASGYLWYVKAEHENRLRWEDHQEMTLLEAVQASVSTIGLNSFRSDYGDTSASGQNARGTQGLFAALEERGNVYSQLNSELETTVSNVEKLGLFDDILKELDKNGAIEENMIYLNRSLALNFDNMLAGQSNFGGSQGAASWGVFNNSKDMALDLGFSGFRRGSYDFYKTDWKYLNDFSTRGGFSDIEGVMIPAGTSTVYDQQLGKNIKRPFLHVRYRASETENRKNKSWITGSVGGAYTTDIDELRMHYLTERCLVTQGANNFTLFTN